MRICAYSMRVCAYSCVCVRTHACACVRTNTHTHAYACVHMHAQCAYAQIRMRTHRYAQNTHILRTKYATSKSVSSWVKNCGCSLTNEQSLSTPGIKFHMGDYTSVSWGFALLTHPTYTKTSLHGQTASDRIFRHSPVFSINPFPPIAHF